jgi:putative flippase GtrA
MGDGLPSSQRLSNASRRSVRGAFCGCTEMNLSDSANKWSTALTRHIPPGQFGRYLAVGAWNTLFGYGSFAFFTAVLSPMIPHSYIAASVISSLLNVSVSFLGYKWFVFKTKGNYLREWMRCVGVYSGGILFSVLTLPVLVLVIRRNTRFFTQAPYIAGAILTAFMVVYSFVGHKKFSFRTPA